MCTYTSSMITHTLETEREAERDRERERARHTDRKGFIGVDLVKKVSIECTADMI